MEVGVSRVGLWGRDIIFSEPYNPLLRSGASRAGSAVPCCWGCRAPHYPMGSALCSRLSFRKPPSSPHFFACASQPFGAAYWRHTPVSLRFWPLWCRKVWRRLRACFGTSGAPGRVYSAANRALSGGSRGAASVQKTTFSLVTPPDLFHRRHTHRHP